MQEHFGQTMKYGRTEERVMTPFTTLQQVANKLTIGTLDSRSFNVMLEYVIPKGIEENGAVLFEVKVVVWTSITEHRLLYNIICTRIQILFIT